MGGHSGYCTRAPESLATPLVGIVTTLWTGHLKSPCWVFASGKSLCLIDNVQTGSTAHPASLSMGSGKYFPDYAAGKYD
jgi:hypothetical protein